MDNKDFLSYLPYSSPPQEGGDLEKQKVRQKLKAREWDELMSSKKKVKVLEAVVRGCVWVGGERLSYPGPVAALRRVSGRALTQGRHQPQPRGPDEEKPEN